MADITKVGDFVYFQLGTPSTPQYKLEKKIGTTDTTILLNAEPLDETGASITDEFFIATTNSDGVTEVMKVTNVSTTTLTVVRGIARGGLDFSGDSSNTAVHQAGQEVFQVFHAGLFNMALSAIKGTIATGGAALKIGTESDVDTYIYAENGDANPPYIKYVSSSNGWVYADDGSSENPLGGAGALTAGDGIDITAGVITVDLAANPGLEFSSGDLKTKVKASAGITLDSDGLSLNQAENLTMTGSVQFSDLRVNEAVAVTSTSSELNKVHNTTSNVNASNLNELTGAGSTILHFHKFAVGQFVRSTASGTGAETVTGVGFTPRLVRITAATSAYTLSSEFRVSMTSWGHADNTSEGCLAQILDLDSGTIPNNSNATSIIWLNDRSTNIWIGDFVNFTTDGFVIDFTLTGTDIGSVYCTYECFA